MITFDLQLVERDTTWAYLHLACLESQLRMYREAAQEALRTFPSERDEAGRARCAANYQAAAVAFDRAKAQVTAYRGWVAGF